LPLLRLDLDLEMKLPQETGLSELDSSKWLKLSISLTPKIKSILNSNMLLTSSYLFIVLNTSKT
jgi:hypothetical protein